MPQATASFADGEELRMQKVKNVITGREVRVRQKSLLTKTITKKTCLVSLVNSVLPEAVRHGILLLGRLIGLNVFPSR